MNSSFVPSIIENVLLSLLTTLASGWVAIKLARRLGLIDVPGSAPHKQHAAPTPLAGGLALGLALLVFTLMYRLMGDAVLRAVLLSVLVIFANALRDDFKSISPLQKLAGQSVAVVVLISLGVYIRIFESPGFFINGQSGIYVLLDWILTAFWMIGITNAFNFVDSMDGLAVVLAGIAAAFFTLVTIDSHQPLLTQQSVLLLGACIGLYFYNAPPARMFLGDAGSQTLGFLLAALAIVYTPQGAFQTSSWFVPILILGVPIFDTTLVVISRLRRCKPIYRSSRDHTYHRLVTMGVESNRAVLVMHIAALSLGCIAYIALTLSPLLANSVFITALLLGTAALAYLDNRKRWP